MIAESSDILSAVEVETGKNPVYAVIWLHGLGADGNDFVPIIDQLDLPNGTPVRFVFPHAPKRPVTINGGYIMRAWYDIDRSDFRQHEDEIGIHESQASIDALITREINRGIPSGHIVLAGFSQGGAMALQTGLRQSHQLAGIIALSCYLPLEDTLVKEASIINVSVPIFMAHGTNDPVISIAHALVSYNKLITEGYSVEWYEYPISHTVSAREISDISHWLRQIIQ